MKKMKKNISHAGRKPPQDTIEVSKLKKSLGLAGRFWKPVAIIITCLSFYALSTPRVTISTIEPRFRFNPMKDAFVIENTNQVFAMYDVDYYWSVNLDFKEKGGLMTPQLGRSRHIDKLDCFEKTTFDLKETHIFFPDNSFSNIRLGITLTFRSTFIQYTRNFFFNATQDENQEYHWQPTVDSIYFQDSLKRFSRQ